ncbi:pentapeptide repeat-containing protein [Lyngbya sp. PCC 8106]|uniref:pentapeptide repeat-containing protein n=1 Tax=Lyngbya sp. (strain PCC 8106) TaxID=313612 RepID=UPI0009032665
MRELLTTGKEHHKSFVEANLRGANLTDADFSLAVLGRTNFRRRCLSLNCGSRKYGQRTS